MRINKNNFKKACLIFVFSIFIAWLSTPFFINLYFDNQPVYSITDSKNKLHTNKYINSDVDALFKSIKSDNNEIYLGQTIVIKGSLERYDSSGFILNDGKETLTILNTNKLNCIPTHINSDIEVAGAWNQIIVNNIFGNSIKENMFYGVWIIDGCDS